MKKNTKIFALVMSIVMLFAAFSLTAFAVVLEDKDDNTLITDYTCRNYVSYIDSNRRLFVIVRLTKNVDSSTDTVQVAAQGVIGYMDGTFDINSRSTLEDSKSEAGEWLGTSVEVYGDTTKMVQYIANDSHYFVNGEAYSLGGTWYAGEDF